MGQAMKMNLRDRKLVQLLAYLGGKNSTFTINKLKAIKLVWAADRYHLRRYGRLVSGDDYYALRYGPVASQLKNISEHDSFLSEAYLQYADGYISPSGDKLEIHVKANADIDLLSKSDIEALEFAWSKFGTKTGFNIATFSHFYPEWSRFSEAINSGQSAKEKINPLDFFEAPNAKEVADDPFTLSDEILENAREVYLHNIDIQYALSA